MAPVPPNSTVTYFFDYTTGRVEHTFQVRTNGASEAEVFTAVSEFLEAVSNILPTTWALRGARRRGLGAQFTLPVSLSPGLAAFEGESATALSEVEETREWVWVGRGTLTGRRVEISLYGLILTVPPSFRYSHVSGPPSLGGAALVLRSNSGVFTTILGDNAAWYPYTNVNFNSYWEGRARRGL